MAAAKEFRLPDYMCCTGLNNQSERFGVHVVHGILLPGPRTRICLVVQALTWGILREGETSSLCCSSCTSRAQSQRPLASVSCCSFMRCELRPILLVSLKDIDPA